MNNSIKSPGLLWDKNSTAFLGISLNAERCRNTFALLADAGKIRPVICKVFPFEEVKAAHEVMAQQKNAGKIILTLK